MSPEKKKDLPSAPVNLECEQWRKQPLDFKSYRDLRLHMQKVMQYQLSGDIDQKTLNAQTYIASAMIIIMDRERQYEGVSGGEDLQSLIKEMAGEVKLTTAQMARIMQQPSDEVRIRILKEELLNNQHIIEGEVIDAGVATEAEEVVNEVRKREWESAF